MNEISDRADAIDKRLRAKPRWRVPLVVLIVAVVYSLITSVNVIEPNQQGVVIRFGRVVRELPSGVHLTWPYPMETVKRVVMTDIRTLDVGVNTSSLIPSEAESLWLTSRTNIARMTCVVQYVVSDPVAYLFNSSFSETAARSLALDSQNPATVLKWIVESVFTAEMAKTSIDDLLSLGKARLALEAKGEIKRLCERLQLGLEVISISVQEVSPPDRVVAAFNDIMSAETDKGTTMTKAQSFRLDRLSQSESEAYRLVESAKIEAERIRNEALGEASRFLALRTEVRKSPELILKKLWIEGLAKILGKARLETYTRVPGKLFHYTIVDE